MSKILYIFRGIAGAGKSTTATKLVGAQNVFSADDYFYHGTEYCFDQTKLSEAHIDCQTRVEAAMKLQKREIAVANTFTKKTYMSPYIKLAKLYGYDIVEVIVKSAFHNIHNVPNEVLAKMMNEFEY